MGGTIIHAWRPVRETESLSEFLLGRTLHTNEHATRAFVRCPTINERRETRPSPEVEVTHA